MHYEGRKKNSQEFQAFERLKKDEPLKKSAKIGVNRTTKIWGLGSAVKIPHLDCFTQVFSSLSSLKILELKKKKDIGTQERQLMDALSGGRHSPEQMLISTVRHMSVHLYILNSKCLRDRMFNFFLMSHLRLLFQPTGLYVSICPSCIADRVLKTSS